MKKKITIELRGFKKLGQMRDFAVANRERLAPGTPAAVELVELISTVNSLSALTASQASMENRLRELSRAQIEARLALREEVEFLYRTARAVAAQTPGFDAKFRMPLLGDAKLLNAARCAVKDAAPQAQTFIKRAMPVDFLDRLNAAIGKLERALEENANAKAACTLGEKALEESFRKAGAAARVFDAIMRNTFRGDPITLEAWKAACRVARATRPKQEVETETAEVSPQEEGPPPPPA